MRNSNNESRMNFLRRQAKEVRRYRVLMKILATAVAGVSSLVAMVYVSAALYKNTGAFTINLNKTEMTKYGLSLSETRDMRYMTSYLNMDIDENITNIDGSIIDGTVDNVDGAHCRDGYLAYTFYLQNAGKETVSYDYWIEVSNVTNDLDKAIRVRLFENGVPTTYAMAAENGEPEPGCGENAPPTTPFRSGTEVMRGTVTDYAPETVTKYTIVVWIEGPDPDCVDFLIGGQLKLEMKFDIIEPVIQN